MNKIELWSPSPAMLRALADVLEQEAESFGEALGRTLREDALAPRDALPHRILGLDDAKPEVIVVSDGEDSVAEAEEKRPLPTGARKRGRPPKNPPAASVETPDPEILPPTPTPAPVPVNPVVTMPNGIVLNAPVETPAAAEPLVPAVVLGAYAKAFQIPAVVALAQREGVQKFTELTEDRQQEVYGEMMQAVALGVPAA